MTHGELVAVTVRPVKVDSKRGAARLRLGVVLWALSWVPYGFLLGLSGWALTMSWLFEICLGLTGVLLAGSEFATLIKATGWRHAPKVAFNVFVHGHGDELD